MNFKDIGVIIAKKYLKENSSIITVFTKNHGLYSGVVQESSKNKKSGSSYQEGNIIDFLWQARLHEHIGLARCELIKSYSGILITNKLKLYAFNSVISLIKVAFHERENHNNFFEILTTYLDKLAKDFVFEDYIRFELAILSEAGYGLELESCAVTDTRENLCYVSPKSGRAVSNSAGLAYKDKLLILPPFITSPRLEITNIEKIQALDLTSYFFNRYFFHNRKQPHSRELFVEYVMSV